MTAATKLVSKKGAKISIERSEVADGLIVAEEEDIAWIAVQLGKPMGAEVVLHLKMGAEGGLGFGDAKKGSKAWFTTKAADPICVVSKSSRFGKDGGWTRVFERKKNKICVVIDEDMFKNKERHHVKEHISMIAFPKAFSTCVQPHLEGEMTPRDTPGWNNNHGYTCASYARRWCKNGAFRGGLEWTGSPTQGAGSTCAPHLTSTNTNCAMVYNYPADNCVACGKGKVQENCCTNLADCRVKVALAERKAVAFANKEKWIVNVKTRILNLEKALQKQAANSAAHKEREVKRKAAWEQARLDNLAAQALLKLRKNECAAAFPGKKKIGQRPADMSSLLETFERVETFTDCRLRCCIPAESSLSVACASVIYDAHTATCFTMSDAYVNPLKDVAGLPIFAAAYERNRGAEAAS